MLHNKTLLVAKKSLTIVSRFWESGIDTLTSLWYYRLYSLIYSGLLGKENGISWSKMVLATTLLVTWVPVCSSIWVTSPIRHLRLLPYTQHSLKVRTEAESFLTLNIRAMSHTSHYIDQSSLFLLMGRTLRNCDGLKSVTLYSCLWGIKPISPNHIALILGRKLNGDRGEAKRLIELSCEGLCIFCCTTLIFWAFNIRHIFFENIINDSDAFS